MGFYEFITEFVETKEELELLEARGKLNVGKLRKVRTFVRGSGERESYFATRYKKWGEKAKGQKHPNTDWEHSKQFSEDALKDVPTATNKEGKKLSFESDEVRTHYDTNFKDILSYNDLHNVINPLGLKGRLHVKNFSGNADTLTLAFNAHAGVADPKDPNKNRLNFTFSLNKEKDGSLSMTLDHVRVPEFMQQVGFFRNYLTKALKEWDTAGIKKLNLIADLEVGGHAWAKYGFDFADNMQRQKYVEGFKKFAKEKGFDIPKNINIYHAWDIANTSIEGHEGKYGDRIGKEFMVDFSKGVDENGVTNAWIGELDLSHGSRQRLQFESYVTGKVLPEKINQMFAHETEKSFLKGRTPEQQLRGIMADRIRNPLVAANGFMKRKDLASALPRFKEALKNIHDLKIASMSMEPGLREVLHKEVKNFLNDIPFEVLGSGVSEKYNDLMPFSVLKQSVMVAKLHGIEINPKYEKAVEKAKEFSDKVANSSHPKVAPVVKKFEKELQKNDFETLVAIDADGKVALNKKGNSRFVEVTPDEGYLLKGKVLIHNHPRSTSFSFDDIKLACKTGASELRVVGRDGTKYSLKRKDGKAFTMDRFMNEILPEYHRANWEVKEAQDALIAKNKMTVDEAEKNHSHALWEKIVDKLDLQYTKTASDQISKQDMNKLDNIDKSLDTWGVKEDFPMSNIVPKEVVDEKLKDFLPIADKIAKAGGRAYIVGGFVRDLVMGKVPKDIDVEVHGLPQEKLEKVLGDFKDTHGEAKLVGKAFGVYKLGDFDIAMPRTEKKVGTGHKGFEVDVSHKLSIEDAARRRDLKFNAMLYDPIDHKVIDPHGGMKDIEKGEISHTDEKAFAEDPLRVFRVARFKATTGFKVHPETTQLSKTLLDELATLPKERIMGEFEKILLKGKKPSDAFRWMDKVGVLEKMFPELHALHGVDQGSKHHPEGSAFEHTMLALDALPRKERSLPVMLGILTHDLGKAVVQSEKDGDAVHFYGHAEEGTPVAESFLKRLTDETELTAHVLSLVKHHMRPYDLRKQFNKASLRRLGLKVNIEDLMKVHLADKMGRGKTVDPSEVDHIDKILTTWDEIKHQTKPMVLGRHLIDMGMKPGKHFGEILNKAFQAQLDGTFDNPEDGLAYVKKEILKASEEKPKYKKKA